jgi:hypothetical protein
MPYLDIAMHYVVTMQIVDGQAALIEVLEGLGFCEPGLAVLMVEEVPSLRTLHYHVHHVVANQGVPDLDDVGVVQR